MRLIVVGLLAAVLALPQSEADLRKVYDSYLAAIKARSFPSVLNVMTAEARADLTTQVPQSERAEFFANAGLMSPYSYQAESVTPGKDGATVSMLIVGHFKIPPDLQKAQKLPPEQKAEVTLNFAREGGVWKMGVP